MVLLVALLGVVVSAQESVLKLGNRGPVENFDPAEVLYMMNGQVTLQIYEPLLTYDLETYTPIPHLARKWEYSEDLTKCTFYLVQGVKFHDGTPFNADAVVFSFDRMKAIGMGPSELFLPIVKAEAIDEYVVQFTADRPFGIWEDRFASYVGLLMVSPTYVQAHATDEDPWAKDWMRRNTCGTGPYQLEEYVEGQYVNMVRFDDYWRGWTGVEFDGVRVVIVGDAAMRKPMLERGETDTGSSIPDTLIPILAQNSEINVVTFPGMYKQYLYLKCNKGPLADKKLRKVLEYAIDMNDVTAVGHYASTLSAGAIPAGMLGFDPSLDQFWGRDVAKAKQMLADAGYEPGEVTLTLMNLGEYVEAHRKIGVLIKEQLEEVGINVEIQPVLWGEFISKTVNPEISADMYFAYNLPFCAEPYLLLYTAFHPDTGRSTTSGWNNGYVNEEVGRLLDEAERTVDRNARAELYREAQAIIHEDIPVLYMYDISNTYTWSKDIQGVDLCRFDVFTYWAYNLWRSPDYAK